MNRPNYWLIAGGWLSLAAAVLHLAVIAGGAEWYRFFGAGEGMARAAERGELTPHLITLGIVAILASWAAYAFAGAGLIRRLPLMRTALVAISAVYLLRGLVIVPMLFLAEPTRFGIWSSLIVLTYGIAYAGGTWRAWPTLSNQQRAKTRLDSGPDLAR
ncbi:MAG: hypothetical protein H7X93_08630 [Sphingomonadaceae bacterium]|nr:hypothetical protein [Sphingomonadaceae bacterium]